MKRTSEMWQLVWGVRRLADSGTLPSGTLVGVDEAGNLAYRTAKLLYNLARLEGWKDEA